MQFNKYFLLVTGLVTLSFTLAISVSAAQVNTNSNLIIQVSFIDPVQIETNIIDETIKLYNPQISEEEQLEIRKAITDEASQTNFDPLFISSVIAAESSFEPQAVSPCAARGLMQLTDEVAEIMQISNPFDVKQNIYAGTRYLKYLRGQFDDPELVLAAYNAGPTRVAHLKRIPNISETINYIKKVTSVHHSLKEKFNNDLKNEIVRPSFKPKKFAFNQVAPKIQINLQDSVFNITETIYCENKQRIPYTFLI